LLCSHVSAEDEQRLLAVSYFTKKGAIEAIAKESEREAGAGIILLGELSCKSADRDSATRSWDVVAGGRMIARVPLAAM